MKWVRIIILSFLFAALFYVVRLDSRTLAQSNIEDIQNRIKQYEDELDRLGKQAQTLSLQILHYDAQINLTAAKIEQTESEIEDLKGKIGRLEDSIGSLSTLFSLRVVETYKTRKLGDPLIYLIATHDLNGLLLRLQYLKIIQQHDRDLLFNLQSAQTTYQGEKEEFEDLQKKLEDQKNQLDSQKKEKANLLFVTRNNEKKYQELLAAARAELAVALGQGTETYLRDVSEGEIIGHVIPTASGCSSGQHLHFEVHQGSSIQDPNNFLKPISFSYTYPPEQYSYFGTINPHGSWNWPMDEPIEINQGFGSHGFAKTFYPGGVHNGIDLDSSSSTLVKAVKGGKLYAGSYVCSGKLAGTLLYAKVDQGDGITTWYLHMTPQ